MFASFDIVDALLALLALLWLGSIAFHWRATRRVPILPPLDTLPRPRSRVSVIVTARNEERRIEHTVRRLLAQRGIDFEIVIVDDRSTDATPRILDRLVEERPEVRRIRVDELPSGWLGKTHACHVGARAATGDWLLFADADVWMTEDLIARAVSLGERDELDHVSLFPREHRPTLLGGAVHVSLAVMVAPLVGRINRSARGAFAGVGAFNLVSREAYRRIGGHAELRLAVVDDLGLGYLLYRAGCRSYLLDALDALEVEWAPNLRGVLRAMEKNMFAALGYSVPIATLVVLAVLGIWGVSVAAPFTGRPLGLLVGLAVAASSLPGLRIARRGGYGIRSALLSPLMAPVHALVVANSTFRTVAQGGIRWRGTFYPLRELAPDGIWKLMPDGVRAALFETRQSIPEQR